MKSPIPSIIAVTNETPAAAKSIRTIKSENCAINLANRDGFLGSCRRFFPYFSSLFLASADESPFLSFVLRVFITSAED